MTIILATLVMTHITIACVTLYLHRSQAHRSVTFHPWITHFMRAWLWLTTGMVTRQWVAIHRKHHKDTDIEGDPHSPHVYGIKSVLFGGWQLYHNASKNQPLIENFGVGTPDDWIERNLYSKHSRWGIFTMLAIDLILFGVWGFVVWGIQMIWIPFWAAGVVNGVGHWWGYRNNETRDQSRNIIPWGIVIGGEELHNNHHQAPASAKLSQRRWEFDIGWMYIKVLKALRLAHVK